jgi:phytoene dehydrogenase-like protein
VPVGGSGRLTDALIACIEDHGGAVRNNAQVREVVTDGSRATGVVLDSGERLQCSDGVIGAIHPHVLPEMVPAVSPTVAKNALRTHITPPPASPSTPRSTRRSSSRPATSRR